MNQTTKERMKELESIKAVKARMPKYKLRSVRIDSHTIILIKQGKDPVLAAENFRKKIDDNYRRELLKR